jgi:clan AA aspartic protease
MAYRVGADWQSIRLTEGKPMGLVRADFVLINRFTNKTVTVTALVDTGATDVFITSEVAHKLGLDPEELAQVYVTLADGRRVAAPRLPGVEIHFGNRSCFANIFVMGDECLVGVIPLEAMDLIVDPKSLTLGVNPAYPDAPFLRRGV